MSSVVVPKMPRSMHNPNTDMQMDETIMLKGPESYIHIQSTQPDIPLSNPGKKYPEINPNRPSFYDLSTKVKTMSNSPQWATRERYPSTMVGLHNEMVDFCRWAWPTPQELQLRLELSRKVSEAIEMELPDSQCLMFGSSRTLLFLPFSDIDMVVMFRNQHVLNRQDKCDKLERIRECLSQMSVFSQIEVIKASVPIIKLTDKSTGLRVDISLQQQNGLEVAQLLMSYVREYPAFSYLTLFLKMLMFTRELNEVFYGGLSSYGLQLMIIGFLQTHPRVSCLSPEANLGVLLMDFLELYSTQFRHPEVGLAVALPEDQRCPETAGRFITRASYEKRLEQYGNYKPTAGVLWHRGPCIQDPIDHLNDVGRNSHAFHLIQTTFESVLHQLWRAVCHDARPDSVSSILGSVLNVSEELAALRQYQIVVSDGLVLDSQVSEDAYTQFMFKRPSITLPSTEHRHLNELGALRMGDKVAGDAESVTPEDDRQSPASTNGFVPFRPFPHLAGPISQMPAPPPPWSMVMQCRQPVTANQPLFFLPTTFDANNMAQAPIVTMAPFPPPQMNNQSFPQHQQAHQQQQQQQSNSVNQQQPRINGRARQGQRNNNNRHVHHLSGVNGNHSHPSSGHHQGQGDGPQQQQAHAPSPNNSESSIASQPYHARKK